MKRAFVSLTALMLMLLSLSAFAQSAAVPPLMNFQGRLAKPDGTPVPNDTYSIFFTLWDAATGGNEKWHQLINSVRVKNGTFSVLLDSSGGVANKFNGNLWLQIQIGNAAPLTPRQQLVSVAYALKADAVKDGAITGASIANATITADKFAANIFNPLAWLLGGNSATNPASHFLGTTDNQPLVFKTNNVERVRISNTGNVGIGTSAPAQKLDVVGNGVFTGSLSANSATFNDNVGIGTITPNFPLSFANTIGDKISLYGQDATHYGFGVQDHLLQIHADDADAGIAFGYGGGAAFTETVRIKGNGNVGIGTINPLSPLHIAGTNNPNIRLQDTRANGKMFHIAIDSADDSLHFTEAGVNDILTLQHTTGNVGIGTSYPKQRLHNTGDYYGKGHFWLHAFEGDGRNGTAYLQARDTSGGSNIGMHLRTQNAGTVVQAIFIHPTGRVGVGGESFSNVKMTVHGGDLSVPNGYVYARGDMLISDARYKQNIALIADPLATILQLRGVTFDWKPETEKEESFDPRRQIGFIAQEVEKVLPDLVRTNADGYKSVAYVNVVPVLVEAVKTLNEKLEAQQRQSEAKEKRLHTQQQEIDTLKAKLAELAAVVRELQSKNR
jgi:hypothetical protein